MKNNSIKWQIEASDSEIVSPLLLITLHIHSRTSAEIQPRNWFTTRLVNLIQKIWHTINNTELALSFAFVTADVFFIWTEIKIGIG